MPTGINKSVSIGKNIISGVMTENAAVVWPDGKE